MSKRDLTFRTPFMNAAGTLGFAPEARAAVEWADFGAFVSNPLSLRPRTPVHEPEVLPYPGGFLLHTGLPNAGFPAVLKKYAPRWADSKLPVIVHLMADRPEETGRMVQKLEELENIAAVELGFAPGLAGDIILIAVEMSLGELPLIVCLPWEQVLTVGPQAIQAGASAISLAAPRGTLATPHAGGDGGTQTGLVSGRLYGPSLFPLALDIVLSATRLGLPVIGAGGVYSRESAGAMLAAGALAVQIDSVLWRGTWDAVQE
jgi:dihydroorotate dehydrogenase (NAD+) catalytic subunit